MGCTEPRASHGHPLAGRVAGAICWGAAVWARESASRLYRPVLLSSSYGDSAMRRRDMLLATGAAALGLSAFPFRWAAGQQNLGLKVLYFTRSAG